MVLIDTYESSNYSNTLAPFTAAWDGADSAFGQSFNTGSSGYFLTSCKFWINDRVDDAGSVRAEVFEHTGTYGTSSTPTGSALAYSNTVLYTDVVNGGYDWQPFTFSGANQITLNINTYYCLVLRVVVFGAGRLNLGFDLSAPTHAGNYFAKAAVGWTADNARDLLFEIYGDPASGDSADYYYYHNKRHPYVTNDFGIKDYPNPPEFETVDDLTSEEVEKEFLKVWEKNHSE